MAPQDAPTRMTLMQPLVLVFGCLCLRCKVRRYPTQCLFSHWWLEGRECMLSHVWLSVTPLACQAPLSMGLSQQEYWSGLPFPSPRDLPNPGIEPVSPEAPTLAGGFFTTEPPGEACGWRGLDAKCLPFSSDHIQSKAECFGQKKGEHSFHCPLCPFLFGSRSLFVLSCIESSCWWAHPRETLPCRGRPWSLMPPWASWNGGFVQCGVVVTPKFKGPRTVSCLHGATSPWMLPGQLA